LLVHSSGVLDCYGGLNGNKYKYTIDQELVGAAARYSEDVVCAFTRQQHSSAWNDIMATILKLWRQIKIMTVNRCVFTRGAILTWFETVEPQAEECCPDKKKNNMSIDMRSVPGLKTGIIPFMLPSPYLPP